MSTETREEEEEFDPQKEFYDCCRYEDEDTGVSLLQAYPEIDPCRPDEYGTTPLHAVAANGLDRILAEIIKRPNINYNVQTSGGNTPLHFASINRKNKVIAMLMKVGADSTVKNSFGKSPLVEAVKSEEPSQEEAEAVDLLIGPDEAIPKDIQVAEEDTEEEKADEAKE
jgi:ankyrin repeat protein